MAIHIVALAYFSSISARKEVCDTPSCRYYAHGLRHEMNTKFKPCQNFYKYVCGNFDIKYPVTEDSKVWDQYSINLDNIKIRLRETVDTNVIDGENPFVIKAKELYKDCMDTSTIKKNGIREIMNYVEETGGWPIIMSKWEKNKKSWQTVDSEYNVIMGSSLFVDFAVEFAYTTSDINYLVIRPSISPGDSSPNVQMKRKRGHALRNPADEEKMNLIKKIAGVMAREGGFVLNETQVEQDAKGIVSLLRSLERMARSAGSKSPEVKTIQEFQASYESSRSKRLKSTTKTIDWLQRIEQLFVRKSSVEIRSSTKIVVHHADYFKRLFSILFRTSKRNIVNTIQWWFINQTLTYTNPEMLGIREPESRWMKCIEDNELQYALAYVQVEKHVVEKTKARVVEVVEEVKIAMKKKILGSKWLDDHSKSAAKEKVDSMTALVGYPDWYNDPTKLGNELYQNLLKGSSYLENMLLAKQFKLQQKLELVGKPWDKWSLHTSIFDDIGYYHRRANTITLPIGYLQEPLYNDKYPDAINYGGIGTRIGYLISHAFDSTGINFDKDGKKGVRWSNNAILEHEKRCQCFIKQLKEYGLSGKQTLNLNIAESTGVRVAFKAHKENTKKDSYMEKMLPGFQNFTSDQLFFVSFARAHCESFNFFNENVIPSSVLVNAALWNSDDFSETFGCNQNSRMNPSEKCSIWQ